MNLNSNRQIYYKGKYGYKNIFFIPNIDLSNIYKPIIKSILGLIIILILFTIIFYSLKSILVMMLIKESNIYNDKRIIYLIDRETTDLRAKVEQVENKTNELEAHSYTIYYKFPKKRIYKTIKGKKVIR